MQLYDDSRTAMKACDDAHSLTTLEVLQHFNVKETSGLSQSQIDTAILTFGRNGAAALALYMTATCLDDCSTTC